MLMNPQVPTSNVGVSQDRISFELQEHHCLYPDEPLIPGTDETECGDDILNAWLPRNIVVRHLEVCPCLTSHRFVINNLFISLSGCNRNTPSRHRPEHAL